jgi:hypothetical protein
MKYVRTGLALEYWERERAQKRCRESRRSITERIQGPLDRFESLWLEANRNPDRFPPNPIPRSYNPCAI